MIDTIEALLIRPKKGVVNHIVNFFEYYFVDPNALDVDHHIFIPERFVLGNFRESKAGLVLDTRKIVYRHTADDLAQYQKAIDEKELEIVKKLLLPNYLAITIRNTCEDFNLVSQRLINCRQRMKRETSDLDKYFV